MLDQLLRQGDRVRMKMDHETRSYRSKVVPNGTLGTVMGRRRATDIYENRYPAPYKRSPGVYSKDTGPIVVWDEYPDGADPMDPEYSNVQGIHLEPADTFFKEWTLRYATEWNVRNPDGSSNIAFDTIVEGNKLDNLERTGDLPEAPFWELDLVRYQGRLHRIFRINYFRWGSHGVRGAGEHCYDIEGIDENGEYDRGGTTSAPADRLTLVERGNVWREAHGEPLVFKSLSQETAYETNMGRATEVRNPANNLYLWDLDEVIQAIKDDLVDGFTNPPGMFGGPNRISARRFHNRELGERVRKETLAGFATAD